MKLERASILISFLLHSSGAQVTRAAKTVKSDKTPSKSALINPNCDLNYNDAYKQQCEGFCAEFFEVCVNPNYFSSKMSWDDCMKTCAAWPRTKSVVSRPPAKFNHLGGDTYACRDLHLWEAQVDDSPKNAAFHCFHSIADGAGICTDEPIEGKGPYEHMRDGGKWLKRLHSNMVQSIKDS